MFCAIRSFAKSSRISLLAAATFGVMLAGPAPALAGRFDTHHDDDRGRRYERDRDDHRHRDRDHHDSHGRGHIGISIGGGSYRPAPPRMIEQRVWIPPVYRTVADRVWIEPVYRTVVERVWIEPEVRTIPDRKWVPDQYEWRDVVTYDHHGRRCVRRERVLVERAHFVECARDIIITPGRWEEHPRQELVCAGRWEAIERQELVCEGRWETRLVETCPPAPSHSSHARIDLRIPF